MTDVDENTFGARELEGKLNAIYGALNNLYLLQNFALLGEEKVFEFVYEDQLIRINVPFALTDFIQRNILKGGTFYEEQLLKKLRQLSLFDEAGIYLDIGANIGNHSVFFSKVMGAKHVTSFEPQHISYGILERNVALNALEGAVTTVQSLVGSKDGGGRLSTHFGTRNLGATAFQEEDGGAFPMTSVDAYCATQNISDIDFIKIDVEGMQMPLFEGAKGVLGDMSPVIWVELRDFKGEYEETSALLAKYGYKSVKLGAHDHVFTKGR